jgi:hypothetical protein
MGWVLYSTKWVKSVLYHEPQHKTQPQHTTTNMSRRRPSLQRRWPSLSMGRLLAPPTNGATASYRSHARRPWSGLAARWLVCLFGVPKRDASKNREMGGALDLGGCHLMMAFNNQPRIGRSGNGDVRVEARGRESAWGDTVPSFGASNWATKNK